MSYHSGNQLINPQELFEHAHIHEGMHIADFGCGRTGHIVFPGSKVLGERGIVYAVDILKDVLESIRRRAALEAIHNVETIWADIEQLGGLSIAPRTLDVAFFVNVLFHFEDYTKPLQEAARVLKDKSRIVVVDWMRRLAAIGPDEHSLVDFDKIQTWAINAGFVVQDDFGVGPYHRCMILFRQE
ncbi:MAG TPA: hypothetical protein DCS29_01485 [Candidatus Magasanikbacteria bacterium]|nr:MAG: hypothetical protein A2479_04360 [Candidatus Magasanikbacteria bacterium RIFOXYC2_FULL_39_8]HAT03433.1 hypothetical protein [Candidatus Magasanikbacteria bacterium]